MVSLNKLKERREKLLKKMAPRSAAFLFSALEVVRSKDSYYPFRQNSYFWYLTEFNEPKSLLILLKDDKNCYHSILIHQGCNTSEERWTGPHLSQNEVRDKLGIDHSLPWGDLEKYLTEILTKLDILYHARGESNEADNRVDHALRQLQGFKHQVRCGSAPEVMDWRPWLKDMRILKDSEEIRILRKAGKISSAAHTRAMTACQPGMFEYNLEGEICHEFSRYGSRFPSYNTIVGSGRNACTLHYNENRDRLSDGDLVLIDAGCEFEGYAIDITRTFPVSGRFSVSQRAIYNIVLDAFNKSISLLRPGISISQINEEVISIIVKGLVNLSILKGSLSSLVDEKAYRQFYMHSLGHHLGLDVHDVTRHNTVSDQIALEPGMVLSIEPGLYIMPDSSVPREYHNIGIRIEDSILITEGGHENLTDGVVKDIYSIESLMKKIQFL